MCMLYTSSYSSSFTFVGLLQRKHLAVPQVIPVYTDTYSHTMTSKQNLTTSSDIQ